MIRNRAGKRRIAADLAHVWAPVMPADAAGLPVVAAAGMRDAR